MRLCPYCPSPLRTTARMTAFSPGQSPPPVSTPILTTRSLWSLACARAYACRHRRRRGDHRGAGPGGGRRRHAPGHGLPGADPVLPPARLGGARPRRDLLRGVRHRGRAGRPPRRRRDDGRRPGRHQPAGDGRGVGPPHRPTPPPGPGVAGPPDGAPPRRTAGCLPEVRPSSGRIGVTDPAAGGGLAVPVSGIAGDQQAALFGQACFSPGMTKNTYGTGSFVLMNVGPTVPDPVEGLLTTVAWTLSGGET